MRLTFSVSVKGFIENIRKIHPEVILFFRASIIVRYVLVIFMKEKAKAMYYLSSIYSKRNSKNNMD